MTYHEWKGDRYDESKGKLFDVTYCGCEIERTGPSEDSKGLALGKKCEKCIENKAKAKEGNNA